VSNTLKKCKVSIFGEHYILVTDETEEHLQAAALVVDRVMRDIASKSQLTDSKRIAVLAALQITSKELLSQQKSDKLINLLDAML